MRAARIITHQPEVTTDLAERLRRLGYTVEVVAPGAPQLHLADIEIDATSVPAAAALDVAAELAESGANVLVAPGIAFPRPAVEAAPELPQQPAVIPERKDSTVRAAPVSRALAAALAEAWHDARASSASARTEIASVLQEQRERLEAGRTRAGERLADWSQRRALRRALRNHEQQLREQRRAEEREARQRLRDEASQREKDMLAERARETSPPSLPEVSVPTPAEPITASERPTPPAPAARKMKPSRVLYSPRDRQFQHAIFLASLVALALMLGFALAMGGPKPGPMPSAMAPPHVNVQQQVPFGPATATVAPAGQSSPPAAKRNVKPAPGNRQRVRRSSAGAASDEDVVVYHYPSRRVSPKSNDVRRYSDTSEEAVVRQVTGSSQSIGVEDRGVKRYSHQD